VYFLQPRRHTQDHCYKLLGITPTGKGRGRDRGTVQTASSGVLLPAYHATAAATVTKTAAPGFSSTTSGSVSAAATSSLSRLTPQQM